MSDVNKTLFHITHWKAGSQWVSKILSSLAPEKIVHPTVGEGQFIVDEIVKGGVYPSVYVTRDQFLSIDLPDESGHFVVLRDLRDTLVSAYFSARYSHALISSGLIELRRKLNELSQEDGMIFMAEHWLRGSALIHASWLSEPASIFRFEDVVANDVELLTRAINVNCHMGFDSELLRQAIESNRFDVLAKGRPLGQEDQFAHERKGVVGDWENYFTVRIKSRVEDLYGPLIKRYNRSQSGGKVVALSLGSSLSISSKEILASYSITTQIYPTIPSYAYWLAWEHAAFSKFSIYGRVLDFGCGDPRFFKLLVPKDCEAVGFSYDSSGAETARQYGRYAEVVEGFACDLYSTFDCVFSRGTLVHLPDELEGRVSLAFDLLKDGGSFICSVVSDKYEEWAMLPYLLEKYGYTEFSESVRSSFGLRCSLSIAEWILAFQRSGFEVKHCIPIVPKVSAQVSLLVDALWHAPSSEGALGEYMESYISARPEFVKLLGGVAEAVLELEGDFENTAGAVFELRKSRLST